LQKLGLNDRQIKAVLYVKEKGRITNSEYQEINEISDRTASRELEVLSKLSVFQKIGNKKQRTMNCSMADKWRIWRINGG